MIKNGIILWSNEYEGRRITGILMSGELVYIALPNSVEIFDSSGNFVGNFTPKGRILGIQKTIKGVVVRTSTGFYVLNGSRVIEKHEVGVPVAYVNLEQKKLLSLTSYTPKLTCYDLNGNKLWERNFSKNRILTIVADENGIAVSHGHAKEELAYGYIQIGYVSYMNWEGDLIWTQKIKAEIAGWARFLAMDNERILAGAGVVHLLDRKNGKIITRIETHEDSARVFLKNGVGVLITQNMWRNYGLVYLLKEDNGRVLWSLKTDPILGGYFDGRYIYVGVPVEEKRSEVRVYSVEEYIPKRQTILPSQMNFQGEDYWFKKELLAVAFVLILIIFLIKRKRG
ncbi:hypothetical protein VFC49_01275 [Thermococcus sp. SY098]|uniref:hypothetical protein n=1 Tax=Thermococcus sp. SY098 TaxID=3111325 RepID=UPI002D7661A1|nr:hypothetical protein [Thermococcus sp. SY098]WRS52823.1 hypothetical protein VFC49_01275 [Thermococcus sp. SY098]